MSNVNHHVNGVANLVIDTRIVPSARKSTEEGEDPPPKEDKNKGRGIRHPPDQTLPRDTALTQRTTSRRTKAGELAKQLRLKS